MLRILLKVCFALLVSLCLGSAATLRAATVTVQQGGSIQAAINNAKSGDTILVTAGPQAYTGSLQIIGKTVTLRSTVAGGATLNGLGLGAVITIAVNSDTTTVIDGFVITNGLGTAPSGSTTPLGGISISGAGATIQNNTFAGNLGYNIYASNNSAIVATNNTFNASTPAGTNGIAKCAPTPSIYVAGTLKAPDAVTVVPDVITGNTITGDGTACSGFGIQVTGVTIATLTNNIVSGTTLGISVSAASAVLRQNLVYNNQTGGLYLAAPYVANATGNVPEPGPPSEVVVNNTFANNLTAGGVADVQLDQLYARIGLYNNLIAGNSATLPALACTTADNVTNLTPAVLDHNDIVNLNASATAAAISGADCLAQAALDGNLSSDPKFTSATDFHLQVGSPAIDEGNNGAPNLPTTDLDGKTRIVADLSAVAPIVDLGAYEFQGSGSSIAAYGITLSSSAYSTVPPGTFTLTAQETLTIRSGLLIYFKQNDVLISSAGVNSTGSATYTLSGLPSGLYRYTATLVNPDGTSVPSASPSPVIYVRVNTLPTTVTLASNLQPTSNQGQDVTFTITSKASDNTIPTPITLASDGTVLATLTPDPVTGSVTYDTSTLTTGIHTVVASYAGNNIYGPSSATVTQQVIDSTTSTTTLDLESSDNPSDFGEPVTFTATVTSSKGTPAGSVTFYDQTLNTLLATVALTPGRGLNAITATATYTTPTTLSITPQAMAVGTHHVVATYVPTGNFTPSNNAVDQVVLAITIPGLTLTSSRNPANLNDTVSFVAHITGCTTGTLSIIDKGVTLVSQTPGVSGTASASEVMSTRTGHAPTATYSPADKTCGQSSTSLQQTVIGYASTSTLTYTPNPVVPGQPVTVTVAVTPTVANTLVPTGQVTIRVDSTNAYITLINGSATLTTGNLATGTHTFTCLYNGDDSFEPSNCSPATVNPNAAITGLTLTASANPSPALSPLTFTAALTGGGTPLAGAAIVLVLDGGTPVTLTTDANGLVTLPATLAVGAHTLAASFAATSTANASSATLTETVFANATSTGVAFAPTPAYQNTTVSFAATVAPALGAAVPYGVVSILDGSTALSTQTIAPRQAATVKFNTATLSVGDHQITATYTPTDGNFLPSAATPAQTLTILPQDFNLTTSVPSLTLEMQHHATITVSVASVGNWNGYITLGCANLPAVLKCEFTHNPVLLPANGNASTTVTLETDAIDGFETVHGGLQTTDRHVHVSPIAFTALLPLSLLGFARRRRRMASLLSPAAGLFLALLLLAGLTAFTGCSGKTPDATPPGTYNLQFTATGTSLGSSTPTTKTLAFTLTVTP